MGFVKGNIVKQDEIRAGLAGRKYIRLWISYLGKKHLVLVSPDFPDFKKMKQPLVQELKELETKRKEIKDKKALKEYDAHISKLKQKIKEFLVGKQIRVDVG